MHFKLPRVHDMIITQTRKDISFI